jgi:7-cyano-7-deazaguanine synthase in queuosine biosynthesis
VAIDTPGCNRVAVGALAADTDIMNRSARQQRVFQEMYACYRARKLGEPSVEWLFPVYDVAKDELAAALPQALLELTWSCRRPLEGFRPCGTCKACRVRQDLRIPASAAENRV